MEDTMQSLTTNGIMDALKRQRIVISCAIIVCLFLTVYGHAPVLPVIGGCILAIGLAMLRTPSKPTFREK